MKGINGNPALDAYQRARVTPVSAARAVENAVDHAELGKNVEAGQEQAAKVTISATAKQLASGVDHGQSAERIATLKQQVEQGTLQLSHRAIAAKMLETIG